MADRVEDAVVAAPVRAERLVGVGVVVVMTMPVARLLLPLVVGGGLAQRDHRRYASPVEPPAMAGSRRTSSAAATTVDSPPR